MVEFTKYNEFKSEQGKGGVNFKDDTIKVALFEDSYSPDIKEDSVFDDISSEESSGSGYDSGGLTVSNISVSKDNDNDRGVVDGDDVAFEGISVSFRYAVMYKDTGDATTSTLIGYADYGSSTTLDDDNLTVSFSDDGILFIE